MTDLKPAEEAYKVPVNTLEEVIDYEDIELPDASDFPSVEWHRCDCVYTSKKQGEAILRHKNEFISGIWENNKLVKIHFAQLFLLGYHKNLYTINGFDNLISCNDPKFVARFDIQPLQIDYTDFHETRKKIKSKIIITKILEDDLKTNLDNNRDEFEEMINSRKIAVTNSKIAQKDMFYLFLTITEFNKMYNSEDTDDRANYILLNKICKHPISEELKNGAKKVYYSELLMIDRKKKFKQTINIKFTWRELITKHVEESIINMKQNLISLLPTIEFLPNGPEDINCLKGRQLFTCSTHDIQLFRDLENSTSQYPRISEFIQDYVCKLWKILIQKINENICFTIPDDSVHTNTVFFQLFKTFLELLDDNHMLTRNISINIQNIDLEFRKFGYLNFVEKRYLLLMKLLNHFKPGKVNNYKFNYNFEYLHIPKSQNVVYGALKNITSYVKKKIDFFTSDVPEKYLIWLYYIHYCFSLLKAHTAELITFLNSLMEIFKNVVRDEKMSLEKARILSNSIINFGTTIYNYLYSKNSDDEDVRILLIQVDFTRDFLSNNEPCLDKIIDFIDIYQVFWGEHKNLAIDLSEYKVMKASRETLISAFNEFTIYIFNLKIYNNTFLILMRSYNEFIRHFRNTKFPWWVKEPINKESKKFVQFGPESRNSYLVKKTDDFVAAFQVRNENPPLHYLVEAVLYLLECALNFLNTCKWNYKLSATSDLLLLMGRSLKSFEQLQKAVDFDGFFNDFTEPFTRVTTNSKDISDFKTRLEILENYYRYSVGVNVLGIDKTLKLCTILDENHFNSGDNSINYSFDYNQTLKKCFNIYSYEFNKYLDEHILSHNSDVKKLVNEITSKTRNIDFKEWSINFKETELPELLAGLSAVWSLLKMKDFGQKVVIKPHIIQILCILRLLGVDQPGNGFKSHLAQVLTGQGKSVILGLVSAIFALTGNCVRVVCYSEYLANRDLNDFKNFFELFEIEKNVNYGTFDDMVNEKIERRFKGKKYDLRTLVHDLITDELPPSLIEEDNEDIEVVANTILLIDEVDVFFTPQFYGAISTPCTIIPCAAIADLQEEIWNLTKSSNFNQSDVLKAFHEYIYKHLYIFSKDHVFTNIIENNREFLDGMVDEMIKNAFEVKNSKRGDWYDQKFKLDKRDNIMVVEESGEYSENTYYRYKNVFMYFKLKKSGFKHNGYRNYGYLNVNCGSISYAMLPKDYSAILGVTGTLKQLSSSEMEAIKSYGISRESSMPTFFGGNKLRVANFTIKDSEDAWTTAIISSILSIETVGRAVIVFFENEHMIEMIKDKLIKNLSRYSILTGNENAEEIANCVQEAGVAKKVTIATRRMGRGIDFQSNDSTVESEGGIHVIQTFFSDDIKEETQIKGRTARKDNEGSYEAILCRKHLIEAGYPKKLNNYEDLNNLRKEKANQKTKIIAENIKQSEEKHNMTMAFLKSFCNYKNDNRNEYFKKYPFTVTQEPQ